jgi:REP element-mobilizing transposase RayT
MPIYTKRRNIRLNKMAYQGPLTIALTLCFHKGIDVIEADLSDKVLEVINYVKGKYDLDIYAYCLMPDHLHLLVSLKDDKRNILDIVKHFKSKVSFELKGRYTAKQLWQDRFYDHVLRKDEDIYKQARYILENPVRKGLVIDFMEYKCMGGLYFEELKNAHLM